MHRLLAHTADLRAELEAADFDALCAEAVALVREILVGECPVLPRVERRVALEGEAESERFFRFVRELVYLADAEGFLPASCVRSDGGFRVAGEPFDPSRHVAERQIKALTRHQFVYGPSVPGSPTPPGRRAEPRDADRSAGRPGASLRAELIFDL
jgi:SHS2 domain-containing protein